MLKRLELHCKLLAITADNTSNNNTLCRYLYEMLSRQYDDHLSEYPICSKTRRFQGEKSRIRCFAHILNLIVSNILQDLGSSIYKAAAEFLDRAANLK
jgi:hypothetical protein